ncbi:MAG: hypothetical protein J6C96_07595 [Oscillospiraceae bacterium]|nr:hypothetical protein [Oscillospiraceae bacterium]
MTATASTKSARKISPPLHNFLCNIKDSRKIAIIITILHLVAAPAVLISVIASIYSGHGYDYYVDVYSVIGVLTTALAAFLGIFTAVDSFKCLHDKSVVDMKLALPMTATQRFFSNFLSGLFTYLAPFLAVQVISLLLTGYGMLFMDGKTFTERYSPYHKTYVCDIFGLIMPILLKLILGGTLCMLMLYTTAVLITVCCGSKFESIAHTILINVIIPSTILCVLFSMLDSLYGIDAEVPGVKAIMFTSVAGGVIATADWASQGDYMMGNSMNYGVWALVFFLITAALGALAFFLYKKRRAEQVSKPFVFKLAYYIIITGGMFCIVSCFVMAETTVIPAIITTAIIYMIFEVVTNRGFKRFWLSIIKYAVTVAAAYAVIFVGIKTEGFGAVQRVPSASSVKSVELSYGGFYGDFSNLNSYDYYRFEDGDAPLLIEDRTNIDTIVEAHHAIIDFYNRHKTLSSYSNYYGLHDEAAYLTQSNSYLLIKYNLKNGGSFTRRYYGHSADAAEILGRLDLTDEYKQQVAEKYKNKILDTKKNFEKYIELTNETEYLDRNYTVSVFTQRVFIEQQKYDHNTQIGMYSLCQRGFFEQLAEAYYNDIMAINEENYYRSELKNIWDLNIDYSGTYLRVPESFTNTVELLEYYDFGLLRVENASDEELIYNAMRNSSFRGVWLMDAEKWRSLNNVGDTEPLHASYCGNSYSDKSEVFVYDYDENFCKLIRAAMPRNIVEDNGYIIFMYNSSGVIPADMADVAKAITVTSRNQAIEERYSEIVNSENRVSYYYD